jgi:hypothetical protein
MQSNHAALVAAFVALLIATGAQHVGAQAPGNSCAQITAAKVSSALGETVSAGRQGPPPTCTWEANTPKHEVVTLMYSPPGDWNTRKTRQMPGVGMSPVSGVGDDALAMSMGTLTTLFVKKGSVTFMVRVYGVPDPARQLAIETPIAKQVASQL